MNNMKKSRHLKKAVIMAGGTGGHVFPGLALARYLQQQGVEVHWLGTQQGMESRLVPAQHIPLHTITIYGVRGKGLRTFLKSPFVLMNAVLQAARILQIINPDVVVGMGGFVSVPGGIASFLSRRPLIIHEQNAKAGLANQLLAYGAAQVLQGFRSAFKTHQAIEIGNPVRADIECMPSPDIRFAGRSGRGHLLVLGGSLGAKALNEIVPNALAMLPPAERPHVWHQTGEQHFAATEQAYAAKGVEATLQPFIADMAAAYAWADLALCRAGALTVAELCAAGLGAVLVPFPYAVDDHQTANAQFMVNEGAAICIQQKDLTEACLSEIIRKQLGSPEQCLSMARAAYQLRRPHVTEKFFDICQEVCR